MSIIDRTMPMDDIQYYFKNSDRLDSVVKLWEYLDSMGFMSAPASSQNSHHNAFEGGLFHHSCNVVDNLFALYKAGGFGRTSYQEDSLLLVGLFHDAGKCTDGFGDVNYLPNVLKSGKVSDAKPYEVNKSILKISSAYRSVLIVSHFVPLYEDEMQAIAHHDYLWVPEGKCLQVSDVCPLTLMLHFADMWAGIYEEPVESLLNSVENRNLTYFCDEIDN